MLTLVRLLALRECRKSGALLAAFGGCVLLAAALLAIPPLFENAMGDRSLRQLLDGASASTSELRVAQTRQAADPDAIQSFDAAISDAARHLGSLRGPTYRITTSSTGALRPRITAGASAEVVLAVFQAIPSLDADAEAAAGALPPTPADPDAPIPVALGAPAAAEAGLTVGDVLRFELDELAGGVVDVEVVGLIGAREPNAPAWHGSSAWFDLRVAGAGPAPPLLSLFTRFDDGPSELTARLPALRLSHVTVMPLDVASLNSDGVAPARAGLQAFDREIQRQPAARASTPLASVLRNFATASGFQSRQVLLVTIQMAGVAAFAVALVGVRLAAHTRPERRMLRARGGSRLQAAAPHLVLSGMACLPAVALAAPLAAGGLELANDLDLLGLSGSPPLTVRLSAAAWGLAAGGVALGWTLGVLPALLEDRRPAGEAGGRWRRPGVSVIHRFGLDVVLLVVAVVLFARFVDDVRSGPASSLQSGGHPALLLSPALLVLGSALVAARILPLILARLSNLARRGGPAWLMLGLVQPARQGAASVHLLAFVLFVAAVGAVAATYGASITRTAEARIHYDVGADLRVVGIGQHVAADASRALAPLNGREDVDDAAVAFRGFVTIGATGATSRGTLLAIQGERVPGVVASGPGFDHKDSAAAVGALRPSAATPGLPLPGDATFLAVSARTDPPGSALSVEANLADASGRLHVVRLGTPEGGWSRLEAALPSGGDAPAPLRLVSLSVGSRLQAARATVGSLWLDDLVASTAAGDVTLDAFDDESAWSAPSALLAGGDALVAGPVAGARGRALRFDWSGLNGTERRYLIHAWPDFPAPAVVDTQAARDLGLGVGDVLVVRLPAVDLPLRLAATIDRFPTLDPARGVAVLVDYDVARLAARAVGLPGAIPATEVWLRAPTPAPDLVTFLTDGYLPSTVLDGEALIEAARRDPFDAGGASALFTFGYLVLLLLAVLTVAVLFAESVTRRRRDAAVLRGLGQRAWGLASQSAVELAVVALLGVVGGVALGRVVAGAFLAFLESDAAGATISPPAVVGTDWVLASAGLVCLLAASLLFVTAIGLQVSRSRVGEVMRGVEL